MSSSLFLGLLQLPGREDRKDQSPYRSVKDAASDLVENLKPMFAEKPYALFGHSSGSWIAYEVQETNSSSTANICWKTTTSFAYLLLTLAQGVTAHIVALISNPRRF